MKMEIIIADGRCKLPEYKTDGSAAIDLVASGIIIDGKHHLISRPLNIYAGDTVTITAGIKIHIADKGVCGLQMIRSSLGRKGLKLMNAVGLFDSDYQGEYMIDVKNDNRENIREGTIVIDPLERIAQVAFMPVVLAQFVRVEEFSTKTKRGDKGHGSTGKGQ